MPTKSRYTLSALLASCLLVYGCSAAKDLGKTLGELSTVRAELIKRFGEQDVNVNINSFQNLTSLSVTYVNSPLNEKSTDERALRTLETVEIVRRYYPSIKNVNEIWVGFMRSTTRMLVFHYSEMIEARGFDNEGRALRRPGNAPSDPSQPELRYSRSQNKTDISSSGIQLEGTTEKGVMLVAHFTVVGDVNKNKPEPPHEVALDFAAFSEKPKFPNLTKLVFLSDDRIAYQTEDQFSTSKIEGDTYCQFLYLKMPVPVFLKILSGSTVKIKVNNYQYTLTEAQVLQLQRMADYLR